MAQDISYPREVWTKAGAAEFLCASMPEEYGGAGGTFAHEAVIDRQAQLAFPARRCIEHIRTAPRKKAFTAKLATGDTGRRRGHQHEPGTGSDLQGVREPLRAPATAMCLTAQRLSSPTASTPT